MAEPNVSGIPGVGAMTDTLEFVKNLWGGMKIPGMAMPSLSVDEVNKQITDLKAVESWLNVNMSMLRSTIQALEVQSATLAALQTMSTSMNSLAQAGMSQAAAPSRAAPSASSASSAPSAQQAPAAPSFAFEPPVAEKPATPGGAPAATPANRPSEAPQANADMSSAAFANPAAWWNLLQDQFKQAVSTAVASEPEAAQETAPQSAKPAPKTAKPRARKAAAPAKKSAKKS